MFPRLDAERLARLALTTWVCAAMAFQAWQLRGLWPVLPTYVAVAFVGAAAISIFSQRVIAVPLALLYVFPALAWELRGVRTPVFFVVWLAALTGVMLPDLLSRSWALPRRWRAPLVYAALAVAVSAIIVVLREIDGVPAVLYDFGSVHWQGGDPPPFTVQWIVHVALLAVTGVLFFDWLHGARVNFDRDVVSPLLISAVALALVLAYQLFVNPRFLNDTTFLGRGRATGTVFDANVAGMLTAMWIGGAWLWASTAQRWRRLLLPVLLVLTTVGLWATGSKTALLAAVACAAIGAVSQLISDGRILWRRVGVAAALGAVIVVVAVLAGRRTQHDNPIARMDRVAGAMTSVRGLVAVGWGRVGYGTASVEMIRRWPIGGVGVGAFYGLVPEIGRQLRLRLPPDNAQNWLRHQLAELGVAGSVGWFAWFGLFAAAVLVPRRGEPGSIWVARGALVAFGAMSMFGMPGQDVAVAITFWVFARWYLEIRREPADARLLPRWLLAAGTLALVVMASASVVSARGSLRIMSRAVAMHQPLSYGVGRADDDGFRPVDRSAAAVIEPAGEWLIVAVDVAQGAVTPVDVRVELDGRPVLKGRLVPGAPLYTVLGLGQPRASMLLEMTATRAGQRRWDLDRGSDARIKWELAGEVPAELKPYVQTAKEGRS